MVRAAAFVPFLGRKGGQGKRERQTESVFYFWELHVCIGACSLAMPAAPRGLLTPVSSSQFKKFDYDAKTGKGSSGLEDMVLISKISEDTIVENIKKRYNDDLIYVRLLVVVVAPAAVQWLVV